NEVTWTDEISFEGDYSVRFDDLSSADAITMTSSEFQVESGHTYKASVQTYITTGSPLIYLRFLDEDGVRVADFTNRAAEPINEWISITVEAEAPPEATQAVIILYSGNGP